jgi:Na+/H+ antiporter NhaD/arsenite permease-like protein
LNTSRFGLRTPGQFFWASGGLSSVLDNAPTYLSFLSAALGLHQSRLDPYQVKLLIAENGTLLQAISLGSVFFGACTYIGHGPNFMVRSVAQHAGIECPSFLGYIARYSLPVLVPVYALIWLLFLR